MAPQVHRGRRGPAGAAAVGGADAAVARSTDADDDRRSTDASRSSRRHATATASTCRRRRSTRSIVAAGLPVPRLRRGVPQPVARRSRALVLLLFGIYAWGLEPGTEPGARASGRRHSSRPTDDGDRRAPGARRRRTRPRRRARHRTPASPTPSSAMWLFLSSDCLFFGAFIATYLLYRDRGGQTGPTPEGRLQHPVHVGRRRSSC